MTLHYTIPSGRVVKSYFLGTVYHWHAWKMILTQRQRDGRLQFERAWIEI